MGKQYDPIQSLESFYAEVADSRIAEGVSAKLKIFSPPAVVVSAEEPVEIMYLVLLIGCLNFPEAMRLIRVHLTSEDMFSRIV